MSNIERLIKELKKIDFEEKPLKEHFFGQTIKWIFKELSIFENVIWKDIIKYSLNSELKDLKLGQTFKDSPNGMYDYIMSGYSFGQLNNGDYNVVNSDYGIMVLKIHDNNIYCYYKIDAGGCPTCGYYYDNEEPITDKSLYMSETIEDIVKYCMSDFERKNILQQYN